MRTPTRGTSRLRLLAFLALIATAWAPAVRAQALAGAPEASAPVRFRVLVEAPRPYQKMLEEGLDIVRWQRDERVTMPLLERLVSEARAAAAEALSAEGYFDAKVNAHIETQPQAEAIVRITVEPGPRTRVRELDLSFSGAALDDPEGVKRMEVIRQTWRLPPEEPFKQSEWNAAKDEALARLARGRYAAARVADSEARVYPEERAADLRLTLDSGPVFLAGGVIVSGAKRYPASIVENLNPLRKGEPYEATQLDLYQRRLLEIGYFNAVHFAVDPDPAQASAAPLRVNVIEGPSQRIDTGIEFNTDTQLGLTVDYGNFDIFEKAWRFRSRLNLNEKEQKLNFSLDTPPRPGGVWDTYTTRFQRRDIEGDLSREAMVGYAYNWGLESTPSQIVLSGHFENETISGATTENNYAVFVGYRKTFRTTDDVVSPRRGVLGTAEIGTSVPGASSQEFIRARLKVNWLIPLGLRGDLLLRGEAGAVAAQSRSGIVSSFLFRTGGDQSIRGYSFESIGVPQWIDALFAGERVNLSEERPALHSALRQQEDTPVRVGGADVIPA
ncbi:MAG: POTRA domain-containing protein, partial [Burkholderiales bacterium]